ncbi:TPA: LacI family DNA-binding transcriptional regulator [Pasteurella multocida]|nr:LacI family DNA-binding transcriptional regulator [Pasteurella multocida]HDX1126533.1 LacI family DNA-binding transcriptional regulator [Pasteurella multocida]
MKLKLVELAKLAGVSRTTASYVVNGKAKAYRVSDKTIEKVEKLIKQYDFKPNAMAAGLRAGKSRTIGLIVPDFENASFARIATFGHHDMLDLLENKVICCVQNHEKIAQTLLHLVLSRMKSKNVKVSDEVIIREIIESRI